MNISELVLERLSIYLNDYSDSIDETMINNMINSLNMKSIDAVKYLLASFLDLDDNKEVISYLDKIVYELDVNDYIDNEYLKNININNIKENKWKLEIKKYKPYQLFVFDDMVKVNNILLPKIGYFKEEYDYPCVLENDHEWMLIIPNEINTMKEPIDKAHGNVLTYGLGLGYFPYMCSLKDNVKSITIVESNEEVIGLFKKYILDQFKYKDKIKIIHGDAFKYQEEESFKYDYVFGDIWHDVSDGVDLYLKLKELEHSNTNYDYWIEKTLKCYIDD